MNYVLKVEEALEAARTMSAADAGDTQRVMQLAGAVLNSRFYIEIMFRFIFFFPTLFKIVFLNFV